MKVIGVNKSFGLYEHRWYENGLYLFPAILEMGEVLSPINDNFPARFEKIVGGMQNGVAIVFATDQVNVFI